MHAEAPSDGCHGYQLLHEFRLCLFQFSKFVTDQEEMGQRFPDLSLFEQAVVCIDAVHIVILKNPLPSLQLCPDRSHGSQAFRSVQVRNRTKKMRKVTEQVGHATALVVDKKKAYFIRMKINRKRQDVRLYDLRLSGACRPCNQPVRAMGLFVQIQIYDVIFRPDAERHRKRFV